MFECRNNFEDYKIKIILKCFTCVSLHDFILELKNGVRAFSPPHSTHKKVSIDTTHHHQQQLTTTTTTTTTPQLHNYTTPPFLFLRLLCTTLLLTRSGAHSSH